MSSALVNLPLFLQQTRQKALTRRVGVATATLLLIGAAAVLVAQGWIRRSGW